MLDKRKIEAVERYIRELEENVDRLRNKKAKNEMEHLINQSDATLISDIANDLKDRLGVN